MSRIEIPDRVVEPVDDATSEVVTPTTSRAHDAQRRVLSHLFGPAERRHFTVRFADGSAEGPAIPQAPFTLLLRRRGALRRMLLPPTELAIIEAFLSGDIDVEGDLEAAADLGDIIARRLGAPRTLLGLARDVLALPGDDDVPPAPGEARMARALRRLGRRHTDARDAQVVRFHYDVGNDFYALWLDPALVYSCAYFATGHETLEAAQRAKLDLVCRKLRLHAGERLLDIGCGWGALLLHAARRYGAECVGITLSERQAALARERISRAGLADRCRVVVRDYRHLDDMGTFDKIASIGMVEHVGEQRLAGYFAAAFARLRAGGLFLNHGIVSIAAARPSRRRDRMLGRLWRRGAFIDRYVFPDGELLPAATVIAAAERSGFEARDVESLREHYVTTLRHWVRGLERQRDEAEAIVGETTFRVWRLYMAASAYAFRIGRIGIIQTLLARPHATGKVELPLTRDDLYLPSPGASAAG